MKITVTITIPDADNCKLCYWRTRKDAKDMCVIFDRQIERDGINRLVPCVECNRNRMGEDGE
jgi:hypothetical protein